MMESQHPELLQNNQEIYDKLYMAIADISKTLLKVVETHQMSLQGSPPPAKRIE